MNQSNEAPASERTGSTLALALGLVLLTIAAYSRVGGFGFVDYDDGEYVYANPMVASGLSVRGIVWAFTTSHAANWHPLTWMSHMLDAQLFGLAPAGHHWMNVLLHALTSVLLFLVLRDLTGADLRSGFAAALFALHPLHVESVVWVAERKDVLSALFGVLAIGAYARYVRQSGTSRYVLVMVAFALSLLSKPMLVTLPFLLLLLDFWPLNRISIHPLPEFRTTLVARAIEKLPLVILAAASCIATYTAQSAWRATAALSAFPLGERVANALVSYAVYLWKTLWPDPLAFFYPHPSSIGHSVPVWQALAALFLLAALSLGALQQAGRRPYLAVGWLWYLGSLVPVIGIVQVGLQARADRYTYIPLIGIFVAVSWGAADLFARYRVPVRAIAAVAGVVIAVLAGKTWVQSGTWRDGLTLYSHAIAKTDNNWLAWNNLGVQHLDRKEPAAALECFRKAVLIKPQYDQGLYNEGVALSKLDLYAAAAACYEKSLQLDETNADAWVNLGLAQQTLGNYGGAVTSYESALRIRPDDRLALYYLPLIHLARGDRQRALEIYGRLLALDPDKAHELDHWLGVGSAGNR